MSTRRFKNSWWVDFRVNHTRYRVRSPENSQAGAKSYEAVLRKRLAAGESLKPMPPPTPETTFAEFSSQWFETYVRTNNKPSTQRTRRQTLRKHLVPAFGNLALSAIDVAGVERYKRTKLAEGLSAGSINHHLAALSRCLHDAVEWGLLATVPKVKLLRRSRSQFDFLSHEEADRLITAVAPGSWRTMVTLALNTGLRIGEMFGLQWNDIDLTARQLVVRRSIVNGIVGSTKSNRERQIPLSSAVVAALATMPRDHQLVFHRKNGKPLFYLTARYQIAKACTRVGLRYVHWHVLRHTFASWLVADSVPLPVVQGLLGHANIEMTMRYSHMAPSLFRSAIDVLERRSHSEAVQYSWATGGQPAPSAPQVSPNSHLPNSCYVAQ
jgi:integrase